MGAHCVRMETGASGRPGAGKTPAGVRDASRRCWDTGWLGRLPAAIRRNRPARSRAVNRGTGCQFQNGLYGDSRRAGSRVRGVLQYSRPLRAGREFAARGLSAAAPVVRTGVQDGRDIRAVSHATSSSLHRRQGSVGTAADTAGPCTSPEVPAVLRGTSDAKRLVRIAPPKSGLLAGRVRAADGRGEASPPGAWDTAQRPSR